jgi:hypothetical protein
MQTELISALTDKLNSQSSGKVQAVARGDEKRRCANCKKLLPKNARPNKKYCNDACKVKAFQNRKEN